MGSSRGLPAAWARESTASRGREKEEDARQAIANASGRQPNRDSHPILRHPFAVHLCLRVDKRL